MSSLARLNIPTSAANYDGALEGLTGLDEAILREHPLPPLYEAGVRYRTEPREVWRHALDVNAEKWGDCEDLSAWRAAELRVSGEDPAARIVTYQTGPRRYHAVVQRGSGIIEDPSVVLGMKVANPMTYREKQQRAFGTDAGYDVDGEDYVDDDDGAAVMLGEDPSPGNDQITFDVYRTGKGWSGIMRLPLRGLSSPANQALFVKSSASATTQEAAKKAVNLVDAVKQSGITKLLPPQAQAALDIVTSPQVKEAVKKGADVAKAAASVASKAASALKFW